MFVLNFIQYNNCGLSLSVTVIFFVLPHVNFVCVILNGELRWTGDWHDLNKANKNTELVAEEDLFHSPKYPNFNKNTLVYTLILSILDDYSTNITYWRNTQNYPKKHISQHFKQGLHYINTQNINIRKSYSDIKSISYNKLEW